jgi:hypothetical protein
MARQSTPQRLIALAKTGVPFDCASRGHGESDRQIRALSDHTRDQVRAQGPVLAVGALVSLVYGLIAAPERGWVDGRILVMFGFALVLGIGFVIRERMTSDPLLDVSVIRRRGFSLGSLAVSATF